MTEIDAFPECAATNQFYKYDCHEKIVYAYHNNISGIIILS